ncbi:lysozyme inhibitor LprI family protein [Commensalibacter oyaizuii]|uniref:Lysozyme inhibitor LprI family protein n=1 Tax=Commensalibacter oyaizuii TaxID=3043873 RepID=A0ABT6Q0F5_9PROT|nr:lysozyme inhibitor LprI family protein [Commensalibacter sp. TBRC 16381]MDI2090453.1 lysozyme inhibitor LprI family protein [Commensalibacter sp. TBRC 16381]
MTKKLLILTGCIGQLLLISSAYAMSCDHPINAYDATYCAASKMIQLDQEINQQYGKTVKSLNATQRKQVKQSQIKWIRDRDQECSTNGMVAVECVNQKMEKRIGLLKSIERECKSSGCDASKLTKIE